MEHEIQKSFSYPYKDLGFKVFVRNVEECVDEWCNLMDRMWEWMNRPNAVSCYINNYVHYAHRCLGELEGIDKTFQTGSLWESFSSEESTLIISLLKDLGKEWRHLTRFFTYLKQSADWKQCAKKIDEHCKAREVGDLQRCFVWLWVRRWRRTQEMCAFILNRMGEKEPSSSFPNFVPLTDLEFSFSKNDWL